MIFPEKYRVTAAFLEKHRYLKNSQIGLLSAISTPGGNGLFFIPKKGMETGLYFTVIATNGKGWDHASISIASEKRTPTWEEMCYIKDLFWNKDECVIQYHPREEDYVSNHEFCLHLWRPQGVDFPVPDPRLVGLKGLKNV